MMDLPFSALLNYEKATFVQDYIKARPAVSHAGSTTFLVLRSAMEPETLEQLNWRKEFDSWPESKLRMFSEPSPTQVGYDAHKAFARAVLAERESAKRDEREEETLSIAKEANRIASEARDSARSQTRWAIVAAISAAIAAIAAILAVIISIKP
ncbi:MAG TPA: hypothetical protein VJT81_01755 [Burkholderiales bacterium]|nr:hypothetical protein [Burkholderiales bacterium]